MKLSHIEQLNQSLTDTTLCIRQVEKKLALCHPEFSPLIIDFLNGKLQYRTQHRALSEMVAKACGAKHKPFILDLTAGLGRDAFLLASIGCKVVMHERNIIMHALLEDGLKRLKEVNVDLNLQLLFQNSQSLSSRHFKSGVPDVIYIDPMHPIRSKSALVKKEMRILRELVGEDIDRYELIEQAFKLGVKKTVVKWPLKQPLEVSKKPTHTFKGKSIRFDVF